MNISRRNLFSGCVGAVAASSLGDFATAAPDDDLRADAEKALRKAVRFFRDEVSTEGGYLWRYSDNLQRKEGDSRVERPTVWVQKPGTPGVGLALLTAYDATGDTLYLDAARDAALALARGQLRSGGWIRQIEFDDQRVDFRGSRAAAPNKRASTLDDDVTQYALEFLMQADRRLDFKNRKIHDAVVYAFDALINVQYPNGAWPQQFDQPKSGPGYPVKRASYPDAWPRKRTTGDYSSFYTLNDTASLRTIEIFLMAHGIYQKPSYLEAAEKGGDFLLLAQMPEPQPAWAQQYNFEMHPTWARVFEPPAIAGLESQAVLRTLMAIYRVTGKTKYLDPILPAVNHLQASRLPNKFLARFYELKTNRPLYFDSADQLTYSKEDLHKGYVFEVEDRTPAILQAYNQLRNMSLEQLQAPRQPRPLDLNPTVIANAKAAIDTQDARGAWIEEGRLLKFGAEDSTRRVITTIRFCKNVAALSRYLAVFNQ